LAIFPLHPEHAELLVELSQEYYPAEFDLSVPEVRKNLAAAEKANCNLSYGIEVDGEFVGYLLAWVENTRLEGRREPVVLVDDICIVPGERSKLYSLFSELRVGIKEGGWGKLCLEAAVRLDVEATYVEHPRVIERLGFRLHSTAHYHSASLNEDLVWMRFVPIRTADSDDLEMRDSLELSEDLLDEED
jgi:hypothetical protein